MKRQINVFIHKKSHFLVCSAVLFACCALSANGTDAISGTNDALKEPAVKKRDPFWPVGYWPKEMQKAEPASGPVKVDGWNEAMKKVVINGVSHADNAYYAVINGQLKSVGDSVSVHMGDSVYTWVVDDILATGSVKLRRASVR